MAPRYVARKSVWSMISIWHILFFWLIIPLIIIIAKIIIARHEKIEFYDNKIIRKSGVFRRHVQQVVFAGVYAVTINQSFIGRIFNYGTVLLDTRGKWDVKWTQGIKDPYTLKAFLETKMTISGISYIVTD